MASIHPMRQFREKPKKPKGSIPHCMFCKFSNHELKGRSRIVTTCRKGLVVADDAAKDCAFYKDSRRGDGE